MPPTAGEMHGHRRMQRLCHCANGGAVAASSAYRLLPQPGEDVDEGRLVSAPEISRETRLNRWFWMRRTSHCGASPDRSAIRRSDQRSAGGDPGHPAALRAGIPEAAETPRRGNAEAPATAGRVEDGAIGYAAAGVSERSGRAGLTRACVSFDAGRAPGRTP